MQILYMGTLSILVYNNRFPILIFTRLETYNYVQNITGTSCLPVLADLYEGNTVIVKMGILRAILHSTVQ